MTARLAAFPKCYLDALVVHRTMTWLDWLERAATLPHIEGVEAYPPALGSLDPQHLRCLREATQRHGLETPMMCASPDFTHPDPDRREREVRACIAVLDAVAELGGRTCRVLSGQRRPEVALEEGTEWVVHAIESLLPHAEARGVVLVLENHYKDGYWQYPEFAQTSGTFLDILRRIDSPWLGVNYDPSNALIAGDDPIWLLEQVKDRVVTVHASDRSFQGGTVEDLRRVDADPIQGYAPFIRHGVIGHGLIDYDRIFEILASIDFSGWISIEDGHDPDVGMENLRESALFLHARMSEFRLVQSSDP